MSSFSRVYLEVDLVSDYLVARLRHALRSHQSDRRELRREVVARELEDLQQRGVRFDAGGAALRHFADGPEVSAQH